MNLALICAGLMAALPPGEPAAPTEVHQAYEEARAKAGRSSGDQVRLALWCESHGLTRERLNHLAMAVLADPANATARGLMGLVSYNGRFLRPEAVAERSQADPVLAEYDEKRSRAPYTAEGQWAMGAWAEGRGLKDQARAHFTAVTRLDPAREVAWKRLGYKKREGRWVTEAQLAAEKAEAEAQRQAERKWKPLIDRCKSMLDQPARRGEAEAALLAITDPRAVPSIGRVFGSSEATQPTAVRLLGQVDSAAASRGLAYLAIFAKSAEARRAATETLRGRDAREYADLLIAMIREPIKYEVRPVGGPGSPGVLLVEGKKANLQRLYSPQAPGFLPGDRMDYDPQVGPVVIRNLGITSTGFLPISQMVFSGAGTGLDLGKQPQPSAEALSRLDAVLAGGGFGAKSPLVAEVVARAAGNLISPEAQAIRSSAAQRPLNMGTSFDFTYANQAEIPLGQFQEEARKSTAGAQRQLAGDVAILDRINRDAADSNARVVGVLRASTGLNLPEDREAWKKWWIDQIGYRYVITSTDERPTVIEAVPLAYQPQLTPVATTSLLIGFSRISCFGAGTVVQTISGPRPIESLRVGDRVLTQSTASGALGYRPILVVHHNPPSPTFRVGLAGDSIVSSHFHRFWVAGRGWVMARDLRPGDPVRTLGGVARVDSVEADAVQPVFNLDVAGDADFFAGQAAALVHDNTLPDPRLVPFDAAPSPVAAVGRVE